MTHDFLSRRLRVYLNGLDIGGPTQFVAGRLVARHRVERERAASAALAKLLAGADVTGPAADDLVEAGIADRDGAGVVLRAAYQRREDQRECV